MTPLLPTPAYKITVRTPTSAPLALRLRPFETAPNELSRLLTAQFGGGQTEPAVALVVDDVVFPLITACARPDVLAQYQSPFSILFSTSPISVLLAELQAAGKLKPEERALLDAMREDAFVQAAVEVYRAEGDVDDLVDTLQRIAVIKTVKQRAAAEEAGNEAYPTDGLRDTVRGSLAQNALGSDDATALLELIAKEHPLLRAAYKDYTGDGDWDKLVKSAARIGSQLGYQRSVLAAFGRDDDGERVLELFRMRDPRVWAAWDVFVDEGDEADFVDTLRRCVGQHEQQSQAAPSGTRATDAKDVLRRLVVGLHKEGRVDDQRGPALRELIEAGSQECNALANAYLSSAKTPADADRLADGVLAVLDAQDELLSDKMREFVVAKLGEDVERDKILGLIEARDERVLEAFEAFYHVMASGGSQDEGEQVLVDQLEALAQGVELFDAEPVDVDDVDVDDDDDDVDVDDDEDDGSGLDQLFQFIREWGLSDAELATLSAKIAANEPDVGKALDAFANNQDPEAFRVALTRAARA